MSDPVTTTIILAVTILFASIAIGLGIFLGLRERNNKKTSKPISKKYKAETVVHEVYPDGNPKIASISNVEGLKEIMSDVNGDGFQTISVDGVEYIVYEEQKVIEFYNKKGNRVTMQIKIDGIGNQQRDVNWIKISKDMSKYDHHIFYVKHNREDLRLFDEFLQKQLYGGEFQEECMKFQDTMLEIARFNELLASRKVRKRNGRYVQVY